MSPRDSCWSLNPGLGNLEQPPRSFPKERHRSLDCKGRAVKEEREKAKWTQGVVTINWSFNLAFCGNLYSLYCKPELFKLKGSSDLYQLIFFFYILLCSIYTEINVSLTLQGISICYRCIYIYFS